MGGGRGTCWKAQNHFNILTFPVATCDLGHLLDICQTRWADGESQTTDQADGRPNSSVVAGGPSSSNDNKTTMSVQQPLKHFEEWWKEGNDNLFRPKPIEREKVEDPSRKLSVSARQLFELLEIGREPS